MSTGEATLTEKAQRVGPAIVTYGIEYENNMAEPWETTLSDMIADIGHWYCNLAADVREDGDPVDNFWEVMERAYRHIVEEREICEL